jgi:hypothetical protein
VTKESNFGMTLSFIQVCAGDIVEIAGVLHLIKQKCPSGRFVMIQQENAAAPVRMSEFDFNQANAILKAEGA